MQQALKTTHLTYEKFTFSNFGQLNVNVKINGGDVQRKNVVNNVDKSSLWAP